MHPESESRKMAFTIELVNYVSEAFAEVDMKFVDVWFKRARELALRVGINFLLRKSEFLPSKNGEQSGLQRSDILFFSRNGQPIGCSVIHIKRNLSKLGSLTPNAISSAKAATSYMYVNPQAKGASYMI